MRIKTSRTAHVLYRYGGLVDGKSVEVKIGVLPIGTTPDSIPSDLLEDMTPREVRELREHLDFEQISLVRSKLAALPEQISNAAGLVSDETLDESVAESIAKASSSLLSAVRRVQRTHKVKAGTLIQSDQAVD